MGEGLDLLGMKGGGRREGEGEHFVDGLIDGQVCR